MINANWLRRTLPQRLFACVIHTQKTTHNVCWFCSINCWSMKAQTKDRRGRRRRGQKIILFIYKHRRLLCQCSSSESAAAAADEHFAKSVLTLTWWTIQSMECLGKERADQRIPFALSVGSRLKKSILSNDTDFSRRLFSTFDVDDQTLWCIWWMPFLRALTSPSPLAVASVLGSTTAISRLEFQ